MEQEKPISGRAIARGGAKARVIDIGERRPGPQGGTHEEGKYGVPNFTRITVVRGTRGRSLTLFEKMYPPVHLIAQYIPKARDSILSLRRNPEELVKKNLQAYNSLKKLGLKVPPTFRSVDHGTGWHSILQTDLTFGGKRLVTNAAAPKREIARRIKNWNEIAERFKKDFTTALKGKVVLGMDEWQLSVDPKTGKAEAFLTDFDETKLDLPRPPLYYQYEQIKGINDWLKRMKRLYEKRS